jgi:HPt (histidine-containing phosphotransfer) domain-containing protein
MTDEPETEGTASGLDLEVIRELSRECSWTLAEFTEFYLSGTGKQLDRLREAIAAGDADEVRRLAHGSVGSSASARVESMAALFREMEVAAGAGRLEEAAGMLDRARLTFSEVTALLNDALAS